MFKVELTLEPNLFYNNDLSDVQDITDKVIQVKVKKNCYLNEENYNIYQIDFQITEDIFSRLMSNRYILHLSIFKKVGINLKNLEKIADTYLYPKQIFLLETDKKLNLITVRVIGYNVIVNQLLHDNGISATSLKQMAGAFGDPSALSGLAEKAIPGSAFADYIQTLMQGFYGNSCFADYFGHETTLNTSVAEYFNTPTNLNSYKAIKYMLVTFWPYLGVPMFHIDDFYAEPKLLFKFDELITSRAVSETAIYKANSEILLKRTVDSDILNAAPNREVSTIHDFNAFDVYKISLSDIINSTPNGVNILKKANANIYRYTNRSLQFEVGVRNPFVIMLHSDMNSLDIERMLNLIKNIPNLGANLEIYIKTIDPSLIDINQVLKGKLSVEGDTRYFYIYEINYIFTKNRFVPNNTNLIDININNFYCDAKAKLIEITDLPKTF